MTDIVVVLTTVAADGQAEQLAGRLVEERLAACVNLYPPMTSTYRWKGKLEREAEQQVVIKTTRARLPQLESRLSQLHSYELPEFIVLQVERGSDAYVDWVRDGTT